MHRDRHFSWPPFLSQLPFISFPLLCSPRKHCLYLLNLTHLRRFLHKPTQITIYLGTTANKVLSSRSGDLHDANCNNQFFLLTFLEPPAASKAVPHFFCTGALSWHASTWLPFLYLSCHTHLGFPLTSLVTLFSFFPNFLIFAHP